jgi:hypothetical protein
MGGCIKPDHFLDCELFVHRLVIYPRPYKARWWQLVHLWHGLIYSIATEAKCRQLIQ